VLVEFKSQADTDKFLSEPREWNGSLLESTTKEAWIESKKDHSGNLPWEHDTEGKSRQQKHFSAFKEMEHMEQSRKLRGDRGGNRRDQERGRGGNRRDQGRESRGRDAPRRGRSRSPSSAEPKKETGEKRTGSPVEGESTHVKRERRDVSTVEKRAGSPVVRQAQAKREKLDDSTVQKRPADSELKGEVKKMKSHA
jgi:hypothetical protein